LLFVATEEQNKFLNDFDFQQIHPQVHQRHIDLLKTIDPDNQSKAVRIIFDTYIRQNKMLKIERHALILMVFLILVLGVYQILIL
jgi:hypothetical protein